METGCLMKVLRVMRWSASGCFNTKCIILFYGMCSLQIVVGLAYKNGVFNLRCSNGFLKY